MTSPFGAHPYERDAIYPERADDVLDRGDLLVDALNTLDSIKLDLADLRTAFKDIRLLLLDGLDEPEPQRDHLREIAKVLSRPTIARFTRG